MTPTRPVELLDRGGHFYRTDFQVHSPRDTQWDGHRPPTVADRETWAEEFVKAARTNRLNAIAISDHHDFAYFPYIKKAASEESLPDGSPVPDAERLIVFPALELTLSVPCQALLILDADFPEDRLDNVLQALHVDPIDPGLESLPQTSVLPDSGDINDLHAKLDKYDWLKGRYIILPNVTPSGHKTLLRTSFQTKYRDMVSVGGYLDGPITDLDKRGNAGEKRILDGKDTNWGMKRLALFQTSDARSADFSMLGEHATWVKWSTPTAEAIRQACLAQESRLSQVEPPLPNVWVSRIVVSQSRFMGRVDVQLNPQYTALIGGRGTGKSTVLDYLRWALCDQPASATAEDEVADPRVRQRRLIETTLKPLAAQVEVHCIINGITHIVRRDASDGSVQLKVGDGQFEKVRESAVQSLLPIQAYSQKQLSSVAIRVDELLRFVTSPIQRELEEIDRRQSEIADRLRENYGTLQRFRNLSAEVDRSELQARSLAEQAQAIRDGLAGISDEDRVVLDGKAAHDDVRSASQSWFNHADEARSGLVEFVSDLDVSISSLTLPSEVPDDVASETASLLETTKGKLEELRGTLNALAIEFGTHLSPGGEIARPSELLTTKLSAYDEEYASVKVRSSAHEAKLAELARLEEQRRAAVDLAQRQRKERDGLGKPDDQHRMLRSQLTKVRQDRTDALAAQCGSLSESSGGMIRASLSLDRGFTATQEKFRSIITGSNVRSNRVADFFEQLASESDPTATWESVLDELEFLMLLESDAEVTSEQTPVLSRLGLAITDQKRIAPQITPEGWLELSLTELADFPKFEYRAKAGPPQYVGISAHP